MAGLNVKKITIVDGGFERVSGLIFRDTIVKKGREIKGNVFAVKETREPDKITITSKCFATTSFGTSSPYIITFELDPDSRSITSSHCSCQAGCNGKCKHGAAVFSFINEERSTSQTNDRQLWHAPSKLLQSKYPKGETVEQLLGLDTSVGTNPFVQSEENSARLSVLMNELRMFGLCNASTFKSLSADVNITKETTEEETNLCYGVERLFDDPKTIDTLQEHDELTLESKEAEFYTKFVVCDKASSVILCKATIGQSSKKSWFQARKNRITASKAKQIFSARKSETILRYFFQTLSDNSNFKYGRATEAQAKRKYVEITGQVIEEVGVFVHTKYPWLCATPDGIVLMGDRAKVLEIKCPSSCRDSEISVPYLKNNSIPKNHPYYFQIQIQMFVCNVDVCDFFVFSSEDWKLVQIPFDVDFL